MILSYYKNQQLVASDAGLPTDSGSRDIVWLEINAPSSDEAAALKSQFGIDTSTQHGSVVEEGNLMYMRTDLLTLDDSGTPRFGRVTFVLGEKLVATIANETDFHPFSAALQRLIRRPFNVHNPKAVLRVLLQVANDSADSVIDSIADELKRASVEIGEISEGYNAHGKELGVLDLLETMRDLNEKEELISTCLEAQPSLARAVRYLNGEVDNITEAELQILVGELAGDVAGVKEHAYFEHEKVRYLQNAVSNILNIKQNQIVKVFTIITAVFLPPTLVGTFYGMNFAVMPELSWEHGFIYSMFLTLGAAILPLAYIKRKGWLR
jgi:magnesium transporter